MFYEGINRKAGDTLNGRTQIFQDIISAILRGEANGVLKSINAGLQMAMSADEILEEAMIPATIQTLDKYQGADFYIPDVINASHAIEAGLFALKPYTKKSLQKRKKIVIGTVEGDIHDIGKNLVALSLGYAGFEVVDLGVNVSPAEFVRAVEQHRPEILAMSALLTTTMGEMARVIKALEKHHLRKSVRVLVGGGPVTKEFAESIGADAYGSSAREAISIAQSLVRRCSDRERDYAC
ncbi:corrinoid protein [Neomoorella thermoacetica]|uniref:corrinoid protein n=1 Tax=Neomoorella thermoacetica TaxID=1525 RepID=UPI00084BC720|nr:corrinoid protein [Moorella thermoacetica]